MRLLPDARPLLLHRSRRLRLDLRHNVRAGGQVADGWEWKQGCGSTVLSLCWHKTARLGRAISSAWSHTG